MSLASSKLGNVYARHASDQAECWISCQLHPSSPASEEWLARFAFQILLVLRLSQVCLIPHHTCLPQKCTCRTSILFLKRILWRLVFRVYLNRRLALNSNRSLIKSNSHGAQWAETSDIWLAFWQGYYFPIFLAGSLTVVCSTCFYLQNEGISLFPPPPSSLSFSASGHNSFQDTCHKRH